MVTAWLAGVDACDEEIDTAVDATTLADGTKDTLKDWASGYGLYIDWSVDVITSADYFSGGSGNAHTAAAGAFMGMATNTDFIAGCIWGTAADPDDSELKPSKASCIRVAAIDNSAVSGVNDVKDAQSGSTAPTVATTMAVSYFYRSLTEADAATLTAAGITQTTPATITENVAGLEGTWKGAQQATFAGGETTAATTLYRGYKGFRLIPDDHSTAGDWLVPGTAKFTFFESIHDANGSSS